MMPVERDDLHKSIQEFFDFGMLGRKYLGCLLASENDEFFLAEIVAITTTLAETRFVFRNVGISPCQNSPDYPHLQYSSDRLWEMDSFVDRKAFVALQSNEWRKVDIFLTNAFNLIMEYTALCGNSFNSPAALIIPNQKSTLSASQVIERNLVINKMKMVIEGWEETFPDEDQTPDILKMSDTARPFTKSLCATVEFLKNAIKEDWRQAIRRGSGVVEKYPILGVVGVDVVRGMNFPAIDIEVFDGVARTKYKIDRFE